MKRLGPVTPAALIVTLVLLFAFQGEVILQNPLHILLIAVPLIIQTVFIFLLASAWPGWGRLRISLAPPGPWLVAGNFFKLPGLAPLARFALRSGEPLPTWWAGWG